MNDILVKGTRFKTGDKVVISLKNSEFFNATIYVDKHIGNRFFMCHNNNKFCGSRANEMFNHEYSWVFQTDEHGNITSGENENETILIFHGEEFNFGRLNCNIDTKLSIFLSKHFPKIRLLFCIQLGIIDKYTSITSSEDGFVELYLPEKNKSVKIKLGRLIRKLVVEFNKRGNNSLKEVNDEFVETLHNKWVSFNSDVEYKIVTGEDILIGYTSKNYLSTAPIKSCMTNRFPDLKIYTDNPDKINLLIFYFDGSVCGRCLIWKCDDGEIYYDRIYHAYDWMKPFIDEFLAKNNYKDAKSGKLSVTIKNYEYGKYPYLDTFYYANLNKGILYNYETQDYTQALR